MGVITCMTSACIRALHGQACPPSDKLHSRFRPATIHISQIGRVSLTRPGMTLYKPQWPKIQHDKHYVWIIDFNNILIMGMNRADDLLNMRIF